MERSSGDTHLVPARHLSLLAARADLLKCPGAVEETVLGKDESGRTFSCKHRISFTPPPNPFKDLGIFELPNGS